MNTKSLLSLILPLSILISSSCNAFMLRAYRFIYYQDQTSMQIPVFSGSDNKPYLIKASLKKNISDERNVNSFLIPPPLFRLEPGQRINLRISLINPKDMPSDKESVFYLNISGIPSTNPLERGNKDGYSSGQVISGTGNIVKFFYRPKGIKAPTDDIYKSLSFKRDNGVIVVSNPTPYHITMTTDLEPSPRKMFMIPPFGHHILRATNKGVKHLNIRWFAINDSSESITGTATIE